MSPLEGIRVLDLSRLLPGPYATQLLANLGAEVIKVEHPPGGDYLRAIPPFVRVLDGERSQTTGAIFAQVNRGKKSVNLNFGDARGRQVLLRIAQTADVLVESYRPGALSRRGLGFTDLHQANPRLIYCSLSGYGHQGPFRHRAGHDLNYLALAGILDLNAPADGAPVSPPVQICDLSGGMNAAIQILAALIERMHTGEGKFLDVALFDAAVGWMQTILGSTYRAEKTSPARGKLPLTGLYPCYHIYETSDGRFISLGALEPRFWQGFCEALGRADLVPSHLDPDAVETVAAIFRSRTSAEWAAFSQSADVCLEPLLTVEETFKHPEVEARGLAAEDQRHVPHLGEDTIAILKETGYTDAEIQELETAGVVSRGGG